MRYKSVPRGRYRSGYEADIAAVLGAEFSHEPDKFWYFVPTTYLPDFVNYDERIIVEAKGLFFEKKQLTKYQHIRASFPDWTICFYFQNPNLKLKLEWELGDMTYREWAESSGYICLNDPEE